jgi:hypothetical protein
MNENILNYYRQHSMMTDLTELEEILKNTPTDLAGIVKMIQGLMLHSFWAEREGYKPPKEREEEVNLYTAKQYLDRIVELSHAPLTEPRPLDKKVIGNCRDHSVLLCALLRRQGIPARARAGCGAYFLPDHWEDHWICEYWHEDQQRWIMVDAQLNPFQCDAMSIPFHPLEVPDDQFWTAGRLWLGARAGEVDPDKCGIFDIHGFDYLRWIVGLDFGALNKFPVLPWDGWGLFGKHADEVTAQELTFLDTLADRMLSADDHIEELHKLFIEDERVKGTDFQQQVFGAE